MKRITIDDIQSSLKDAIGPNIWFSDSDARLFAEALTKRLDPQPVIKIEGTYKELEQAITGMHVATNNNGNSFRALFPNERAAIIELLRKCCSSKTTQPKADACNTNTVANHQRFAGSHALSPLMTRDGV